MSHFHLLDGRRISYSEATDNVVPISGAGVTIGIWGYKDFDGQPLDVLEGTDALMIPQKTGISGDSSLWRLQVKPSVAAARKPVEAKIYAQTSKSQTWDVAVLRFDCNPQKPAQPQPEEIEVSLVTQQLFGGDAAVWRSVGVDSIEVANRSTLSPKLASVPPEFTTVEGKAARIAFFLARFGTGPTAPRRSYIVLAPFAAVNRVLVMITHGFGQNTGYYASKGWSDPLSRPLIDDVRERFVQGRWGPQVLAARNDTALILPVRSAPVAGSELGPFGTVAGAAARVLRDISGQCGFGMPGFEIATYSSGIYDANRLLPIGGLSFDVGYNQDPAGGYALAGSIRTRKQFLSGMTTKGQNRPGFTLLPLPWFKNHGSYADTLKKPMWLHDVLHPYTTLYVGMVA